jgi:acyl-CoA thioesterase-2
VSPSGSLLPFTVEDLLEQFLLERIEEDVFRAFHGPGSHVFGGQVLGQAISAATATVDAGRTLHSLHAYFLRPGDSSRPLLFNVERIRDGRSFSTRRVVGIQAGAAIFNLSASFQPSEESFEHQVAAPAATAPENLPSDLDYYLPLLQAQPWLARFAFRFQVIDSRQVEGIQMVPTSGSSSHTPHKSTWMRIGSAESGSAWSASVHQSLLAYMSDMDFMSTSVLPHRGEFEDPSSLQRASLDHAVWFHRPVRADRWLLYVKESPSASGARGFVRGQFFDRSGKLVASTMQECLIRRRPVAPT